jgi:hypothetical protein
MFYNTRANNGVDMSIIDMVYNGDHNFLMKTKVVKQLFQKQNISFIGVKNPLQVGEVIEVGDLSLSYKIVSFKEMLPQGGFVYRVKRTDGSVIGQTDINNAPKGAKVRMKSRRSIKQKIQQLNEMLDKPK